MTPRKVNRRTPNPIMAKMADLRPRQPTVSLWCNRMAGDNELPEGQRFTRSNIKTHGFRTDPNYWLVEPAGLLGPVKLIPSNIKD